MTASGLLRQGRRGRLGPVPAHHLGEGDTAGEGGGGTRATTATVSRLGAGRHRGDRACGPGASGSPRDRTSGRSVRGREPWFSLREGQGPVS